MSFLTNYPSIKDILFFPLLKHLYFLIPFFFLMLCDLLQENANQILSLSTKTLEEMKSDPLTGPLYIGTGQTDNLNEIVKMMKLFQERYPHVQFHLLSDDKETLLKQLEINLLDFGLFIHDYDRNLYERIPLKSTNSLGILAFKEHPFASKKNHCRKRS